MEQAHLPSASSFSILFQQAKQIKTIQNKLKIDRDVSKVLVNIDRNETIKKYAEMLDRLFEQLVSAGTT